MGFRIVTTDYAPDGQATVEHHDVEGSFDDARMDAEQLRDKHAVVSIYRYTSGEPDLLWSTRAEQDTVNAPEVKVGTAFFTQDNCAICERQWEAERTMPFPTACTVESIDAGDPPQPVCDDCIREHYPPDVMRHL